MDLKFILMIAVVAVFIVVIQSITSPLVKKANRGILNKKQYQEQESVTRQKTVFTAKTSLDEIHHQLPRFVVAREEKGITNDLYISSRSRNQISYVYGGKLDGLFSAEIGFAENADTVEATFVFRSWREYDGLAPQEVMSQMKALLEAVTLAFRAADPDVLIRTAPINA